MQSQKSPSCAQHSAEAAGVPDLMDGDVIEEVEHLPIDDPVEHLLELACRIRVPHVVGWWPAHLEYIVRWTAKIEVALHRGRSRDPIRDEWSLRFGILGERRRPAREQMAAQPIDQVVSDRRFGRYRREQARLLPGRV